MSEARYAIGIDLGTTNCVVAKTELAQELRSGEEAPAVAVVGIPQLTKPGEVETRTQLPSFLYLPHESELAETDTALPWTAQPNALVGSIARYLGSKTPLRLVASAKSWLCHGGVDRRAEFLPLNAPEDVSKVSPLISSVRYLEHLVSAWNAAHPDEPVHQQEVVVTIPASFDPAARELTAEAAHLAGIQHLTLLEEPLAAVYAWIQAQGKDWREFLSVGDVLLVVDVGGGTTDLSLIAVNEVDGSLVLDRIAVGDHILLGGDNMDLALAYRLHAKLSAEGKPLQPWQIQALTHACRDAKEQLLALSDVNEVPIAVPSRGSKLIGATLRTELTRADVEQTLVDGFFPIVGRQDLPQQQARTALTQMGLPYAQDAAITRHLAGFLSRQANALGQGQEMVAPTAVLLNGGVLKAPMLSERLMSVLNQWLAELQQPQARLLSGADLDLAVARGAAYYANVKRGRGVRIRGGLASAYYVGVESAMPAVPGMPPMMQALCVAPFGMEEGTQADVPHHEVGLVVGQPVRFRFFGSTVRREDEPGTLLDLWGQDDITELPAIEVTLDASDRQPGEIVPVHLASSVTAIGTLCLEAIPRGGHHRWRVEFSVRDGAA